MWRVTPDSCTSMTRVAMRHAPSETEMARGNEKQVSAEIDATATTAAENDMTCERGPRMFVTSHGSLSSAQRK